MSEAILIKAVPTGNRVFGTKGAPSERTATVEGIKLRVTEADTWSSGEHPGDGEYIRCTWLAPVSPVDPWPNLKEARK